MKPCPICSHRPAVGFPEEGGTHICCPECLGVPGREMIIKVVVDARPGKHPLAHAAREPQVATSLWNGLKLQEAA